MTNKFRMRCIGAALAVTLTVGASAAFAAGAFAQGGSSSGTSAARSATGASSSGGCSALFQGNGKLPPAMQTALADAKSDPNSQPGCALEGTEPGLGEDTATTSDCWSLLERDKGTLPPAAQTALAIASADPNSHPGCAIQVSH